jgi:hypothetical protein
MTARASPILHARSSLFAISVLIITTLLLSSQVTLAQFTQQGWKLVGTGAAQGYSVALSADGNTSSNVVFPRPPGPSGLLLQFGFDSWPC